MLNRNLLIKIRNVLNIRPLFIGLFFILIFLNMSSLVSSQTLPNKEMNNILIIQSYNQGISLTDEFNKEIDGAFLRSPFEVTENHIEYLDAMRVDYEDDYSLFAEYLRAKYDTMSIQGIICVGGEAYEFVNRYHESLFDSLPAVYLGVEPSFINEQGTSKIEGINPEIPFSALFNQMKQINPDIKQINIYTNSNLVAVNYNQILKRISEEFNLPFQIYSEQKAETYLQNVLAMKQSDGVILLSSLYDERGTIYTMDYLFDEIDLHGEVPVLTIEEYYVGKGATGSIQYNQKAYVAATIEALQQKIEGNNKSSILSNEETLELESVIDYGKIQKLQLTTKNLDSNVIFRNKPSIVENIQSNALEFVIVALVVITVILIFSVVNLLLRLKAENDREETRIDLQMSYMELEAAHEQLVAGESELNRQFKELQIKEDELRKSRERYRLAAKGSEFGIWDIDMLTGKMYFSNKGKEILGLPMAKELFGMAEFYELFEVKEELAFRRIVDDHINQKLSVVEYEAQLMINGCKEWVSIRGKALFNEKKEAIRLAGSLTNITQEKAADEKLLQIAFKDELTGLNNKAYFNNLLQSLCENKSVPCHNVALMLIDLDNFKIINDTLGHNYGDEVLKKVADILKAEIGKEQEVIRFGGDEFIVLVKNYKNRDAIEAMATNLITTFRRKFDVDGIGFSNTLSIGIAFYLEESNDIDTLLKQADLALNEAKAEGRNQYVYYDERMQLAVNHSLWFERELESAIENKQFELYYQAKYDIESDRVSGYEALIRWHNPEVGIISPSEFIPVAEANGMIISIGEWVVKEAIDQLDEWHKMGYDDLKMSINLSAKQFNEVNLTEVIEQAMAGKLVEARHVEFEITETTAIFDVDSAIDILNGFKEKGYQIALDDFGTGYSSLNYLSVLPIDTLKIDKSFVDHIMTASSGGDIVKTVIQLAHANNMAVVAEGVEDVEQFEFLRKEQCDLIQGYYISRPVPAKEAIKLVGRRLKLI